MQYLFTCLGGNHHTFRNDAGELVVLETHELAGLKVESETKAAKYQGIDAALPAAVRADVARAATAIAEPTAEEPIGEVKPK